MKRPFASIIIILFLLLGVLTVAPIATAGPFEDPLINHWLNNNTSEPDSHVSNYSISSPHRYFSGGQDGPKDIEDRLNKTPTETALYFVHDPVFKEYPTEPVYEKWNSNNIYDYNRRPMIPEFKKGETKETKGANEYNLGSDETVIKEGWVGIYSIQPSAYVHYGPPNDENPYGQSAKVVGDTVTVLSIVEAKRGIVPDTRTIGSGVGATRYQYTRTGFTFSANVYIKGTNECPSRCLVGTAPVSQSVAEFTSVSIDEYANPGERFQIIVEGTATVEFEEDIDNHVEVREEVPCSDPENQTAPCYDYDLEWQDDTENTQSHSITMQDSQVVMIPKGLNSNSVQSQVTYERGVYPNGTTEIHIDTSELEGTFTEKGVWQRIEIGDEKLYTNWRSWSGRNMSWDIMYTSEESNEKHLSHTRPLAFHIAPVTTGYTATDGIEFRRTQYGYGWYFSYFSEETYYTSPTLRTHETCRRLYPEHNDNPDQAQCGWWITGTGTIYEKTESPPYLQIKTQGQYKINDEVYITAPNSESETQTLDMYGFVPNQKTEIEPDRNVDIKKTEIYAVIIEENLRNKSSEHSWIKVRLTLVNSENKSRISTEDRFSELTVQNSSVAANGEYVATDVETNESGQAVVKIYNPGENDIHVSFDATDWTLVEEGKTAYMDSKYSRNISTPAFSLPGIVKTIIGFGTVLYVIIWAGIRFMLIIQFPVSTSVEEELRKMFPGEWWKIVLWSVIVYAILSAL